MIRNLILSLVIILFLFGLHAEHHWISLDESNTIAMFDVYPVKNQKIIEIEEVQDTARNKLVFTEMIADNNEGIVNALRKNTKRFRNDKEGLNSKFNKFIKNILLELNLNIEYDASKFIKSLSKAGFEERHYTVNIKCEYEDLIAFIDAIERNERIYNVEKLKIINSPQKNISGIKASITLSEININ